MKNKKLNAIAKTRAITFDDIVKVMNEACEERVRRAIESSNYSKADVLEKLSAAECIGIEEIRLPHGTKNCVDLTFEACFLPGEAQGIDVFWSRQVTVRIENHSIVALYYSGGGIVFKYSEEVFEIDVLRAMHAVHPESFDTKWYCA